MVALSSDPPESASTCITPTEPTRLSFTGSCHCGATRYVAYINFPLRTYAPPATATTSPLALQEIYRCNCTTCHKIGFFHLRFTSAPDDFMLLAPLDPTDGGLGDYTCFAGDLHFLFCKRCAVRCFIFCGPGEVVEVEEPEILRLQERKQKKDGNAGSAQGENDAQKGRMIRVWRPKKDEWTEGQNTKPDGPRCYLSVNAQTLDAAQEGLDLREWTEQKKVLYIDCLELSGVEQEAQYDRPFYGGSY